MEELNNAEQVASPAEAEQAQDQDSQSPLQKELEKVKQKGEGRTKREKLVYTKKRVEQQLRELDGEEGIEPDVEEDDENAPVTVGMLKKLEAQKAQKTAIQMADDIQDKTEAELVKYHLENTIRSAGNPSEDFRNARALVNSAKNTQIAEELARKTPGSAPRSSGAPANRESEKPQLTTEELAFMRPPFNLSEKEVLEKRPKFSK